MSDLFSKSKNFTLTPRSLMLNLKSNDSIPSLNIEQILINWINTIGEPHCLLLENLYCSDVIETGIIFVEILKNFLRHFGINDFNPDNRLTKEEKVNLVLTSLMELNKENNFDNFLRQQINYFFSHSKEIFKDKKELISFFEMLKRVYDNFGLNNEQVKTKQLSMDNNDKNNNIFKFENKFLEKYKDNKKKDAFLQYELKQKKKRKFQTFFKNFSIQNNNNNNILNVLMSPQIKENQKKKNISTSLSPTHNITLSISPNNSIPKNFLFKKAKPTISYYKSKVSDSLEKKNNSQSTNINSVPSKKENLNNINSECNEDNKCDKKLFSQINMTVGLLYKSFDNIEGINYYYFPLPSKPIIDISLNNKNKLIKYTPQLSKNIILNREKILNDNHINYNNYNSNHNKKNNNSKKEKEKEKEKNKENEIKEIPKITKAQKNIIKNWLNSLKLFPKENLTEATIIYLSHNGILLCDIVNRCNSSNSNSVIKGVIKDAYINTQKKINIHKFFKYIYNYRKLYDNLKVYLNYIEELICQNEDIIYGILYGLYKYFNKDFRRSIPISKTKPHLNYKNQYYSKENSKEKNNLKENNKCLKTIRSWLGKSSNNKNKISNSKNNNKEESNFLNGISINSEFNVNISFDDNGKNIKRKSFMKVNSPSVSQCSSILLTPSINTTFDDLKDFAKDNNNNNKNQNNNNENSEENNDEYKNNNNNIINNINNNININNNYNNIMGNHNKDNNNINMNNNYIIDNQNINYNNYINNIHNNNHNNINNILIVKNNSPFKKLNVNSSLNTLYKGEKKLKNIHYFKSNENSPRNKEKMKLFKNCLSNNNYDSNPKCFLVFQGSNLNRMKKETEKVIKY